MLYSHRSRRSLSSALPLRYVTREPSGEILRPTIVGPAKAGASNKRSMVSSAPLAPVATAHATSAGAKYRPELRESVMKVSPIGCDNCLGWEVYYTGAHAAVFSTLILASHRRDVRLGGAAEND